MTLYHSTFRWFGALACTTTPMGQPYNWFPSSQLQHAERYSCRCSASRHTTRRRGFFSINYLRINIFLFLLSYPASTETPLAGRCCYAFVLYLFSTSLFI